MIQAALIVAAARKRAIAVRLAGALLSLVIVLVLGFVTLLVILAGGGAQHAAEVAARSNCGSPSSGGSITVADVPSIDRLTAEQARNAATIAAVAEELWISDYGAAIAIAVAWQESRLVNVDYGHRDSLGLFQQRQSTGWGSPAQITDPVLAARAFFGRASHTGNTGLLDVAGWESMSLGAAAQAVQRSADPTGGWYAEHELFARQVLRRLGEGGPQGGEAEATLADAALESGGDQSRRLRIVHANIPTRSANFTEALRKVVSQNPDLVSLNEMNRRGRRQFTPPGYASWRAGSLRPGPPTQSLSTAVLWRTDRWERVDAGRVQLVRDGPQRWDDDRYANWVTVQSEDAGQVSMISVHHIVNPRKYGPNRPLRRRLYRKGMEHLQQLVRNLSVRGPVFLAGDMNSQFKHNDPWGPRATLAEVGMRSTMDELGEMVTHVGGGSIDYIFYQDAAASPVRQWTGAIPSDHRLVGADFRTQPGGLAPITPGMGGLMCGTGLTMDCPATPWSDLEEGLTPDALRVLRCVHQQFPEIESYAGLGHRENNPGSSHEMGRAVDLMISAHETAVGRDVGDRVAEWVRQNASALGVNYVIWDGRIWSVDRADEGWRPYEHPRGASDPTSMHRDHVHVDVFGNAAGTAVDGPWTAPVQVGYTVSAEFGDCSALWSDCHTGLDFAAPEGTPVVAASAGTVVFAGNGGPYGHLIKVAHNNGVQTWYGHLSSATVTPGTAIQPGEVIGQVGSTGNVTGSHLHFEVRQGGAAVDPATFLEAQGVLR